MEKINQRFFSRLLPRFLTLIIIFIIADFLVGSALNYLYFYPNLNTRDKTSYAIENSNEQIIIYGASTALNHFNPAIIRDKTGRTCYNAGFGGQSILYVDAINRCILKRYRPEIIILNIDWTIFDKQSFQKLGSLLPYYKRHPEIRELIRQRSNFEKVKLLSHIYPFNSFIYQLGRQLFGTQRKTKDDGFLPEYGTLKINYAKIRKDLSARTSVSREKCIAFNNVIALCKDKNVNLVFTITPIFDSALIDKRLFSFAESLAYKNNIPLFDFSKVVNIYGNKKLFIDHGHLNGAGADLFTKSFSDTLSAYIQKRY